MKQTIVITGASQGFGKLISLTLAGTGHNIIATMRNIRTKNKSAAEELSKHANIDVVELDVSDANSVKSAVQTILQKYSTIDVWVNNAGVMGLGLMEATSISRMRKMFEINFWGMVTCTQAILPSMRRQGAGLIVNISSGMGIIAAPFAAPYVASKFAIEGFTASLRAELESAGIEFTTILPGAFPTSLATTGEFDAEIQAVKQEYGGKYSSKLSALFEAIASSQEKFQIDPQEVADVVDHIIETPAGIRPHSVAVNRVSGNFENKYFDFISGFTNEWMGRMGWEAIF